MAMNAMTPDRKRELTAVSQSLRAEADGLLYGRGLLAALQKYGKTYIVGSYFLDTMAWRDLDLYVDSDNMPEEGYFRLAYDIATAVNPGKMHYRNEFILRSGLPLGRYWGVYTDPNSPDGWKIDLWAISSGLCDEYMAASEQLNARITNDARLSILDIKSAVWAHPLYRKDFTSMDIYHAVLDGGVEDTAGLMRWLKEAKGLDLKV